MRLQRGITPRLAVRLPFAKPRKSLLKEYSFGSNFTREFILDGDLMTLFPLLSLWGNKNWPPSMKVKKMENFQNKRGLKGCK